jgi:hypothetical protein
LKISSQTGVSDKRESPQHLVDGRRWGPTPRRGTKNVVFAVIETHLSHGLHRTHDNRTPYAVDVNVMGGGRSAQDQSHARRQLARRAHFRNPFAFSHCSSTVSTTEAFERAFAFAALARATASDGLTFVESVTERVSGRGGSAEGFFIADYFTIMSI